MRIIPLVACIAATGCSPIAQLSPSHQPSSPAPHAQPADPNRIIGVVLRHGSIAVVRATGAEEPAERNVILNDGSRVLKSGKIQTPHGWALQLREGEAVTMDGILVKKASFLLTIDAQHRY